MDCESSASLARGTTRTLLIIRPSRKSTLDKQEERLRVTAERGYASGPDRISFEKQLLASFQATLKATGGETEPSFFHRQLLCEPFASLTMRGYLKGLSHAKYIGASPGKIGEVEWSVGRKYSER